MRGLSSFAVGLLIMVLSAAAQAQSNLTTVCRFTVGPRAGTTFDFAVFGFRPIPVGTPCNDGQFSSGIAIASSPGPVSTNLPPGWRDGRACDGGGHCTYFIRYSRLPKVTAQQTIVWCWAAAAQNIFRYYGHDVPQPVIVQKAYGTVAITTGRPDAMLRMLNTSYTDSAGSRFSVSTPRYFDKLSLLNGRAGLPISPTLTNQIIFDELANGHPIFYADNQHAMALVGAEAIGINPIRAWVLDPAPIQPAGIGPIVAAGVPAVGLRMLSPQEMIGFFAAEVTVQ